MEALVARLAAIEQVLVKYFGPLVVQEIDFFHKEAIKLGSEALADVKNEAHRVLADQASKEHAILANEVKDPAAKDFHQTLADRLAAPTALVSDGSK